MWVRRLDDVRRIASYPGDRPAVIAVDEDDLDTLAQDCYAASPVRRIEDCPGGFAQKFKRDARAGRIMLCGMHLQVVCRDAE